jgi:hypothetical protein
MSSLPCVVALTRERVARVFLGKQGDIEVASLQIGFQLEARRLPLVGMSY